MNTKGNKSEKSFVAVLLLAVFLGFWGAHRFYAGKIATGLIWLFTIELFFKFYQCKKKVIIKTIVECIQTIAAKIKIKIGL